MQKNNNPAHCDRKEIQNNYTMIQNNYKELQEEMTARDASVYKIVRKMNTKSQKKKKKLLQNDFKIMHDGLLKMQNNYQIIKVDNRITKTWRRKEYNRRERQLY